MVTAILGEQPLPLGHRGAPPAGGGETARRFFPE